MPEKEIKEKGGAIEEGPVTRHGALGEMKSIYLRDPDAILSSLPLMKAELDHLEGEIYEQGRNLPVPQRPRNHF